MVIIDVGMPVNWISNLRLLSTLVDALWMRNVKYQPLSNDSSTVLSLSGIIPICIILVGSSVVGITMLGDFVSLARLSVPCAL